MNATDLLNSITSKGRCLETKNEKGEIIHRETSGWMSIKQVNYLISLIEAEDDMINCGIDFCYGGVFISRTLHNGSRTYLKIERNL